MTDSLHAYMRSVSLREPSLLARLREETTLMPMGSMQISPEQGQFMRLLAKSLNVHRYIEVGTFTGYSALSMALAIPKDGEIVCCDISEEFTNVARRYWKLAEVDSKITLILGDARETLSGLLKQKRAGTFDMMFIDADKEPYLEYYELGFQLLRPNGLILVDNVLWGGSVADGEASDPSTVALRSFNSTLHSDNRIDLSMVPIGDGLTIARKI